MSAAQEHGLRRHRVRPDVSRDLLRDGDDAGHGDVPEDPLKPEPASDRDTRHRLIAAATRLFGERGFKYVTVRAICREASANIAAVNYHFGDKLGLYRGVFEEAAAAVRRVTEEAVAAGRGRPPAEQLEAYIRLHCDAVFVKEDSTASAFQLLFHREMMNPMPAIAALVERAMRPRFEYLSGVVAAITGRSPKDEAVLLAAAGIQMQVVTLRPALIGHLLGRRTAAVFTAARVTAHLTAFSLAGLAPLRRPAVAAATGRAK